MNFGLSEKTVLLTGPTSSLGRAIALQLAEMGANLALIDKNEDKVRRLATEIMDQREVRESYGRAAAVISDITKPHHVKEAVGKAAELFGGIDVYIDALVAAQDHPLISESSTTDLDRLVDVNLKAPFLLTQQVLKFIKDRRRSRIIYLIPDLAVWGGEGESMVSATRTGLSNLVKVLAKEHAGTTMTVNCVSVGPTEDYLLMRTPSSTSTKDALDRLVEKNAYVELSDANEVAQVVAFLASGLSGAINGQTLVTSKGL